MDLSNNNMIHIKNKEIEYLSFKRLLEFDNLINCYTLRVNNINFKENNEEKNNSYDEICKTLKIKRENIIIPKQTHSDNIKEIKRNIQYENTDALITNEINNYLTLSFADCMPVLIYDKGNKAIANIHSGWRGTCKKITLKTVRKMQEIYNSKINDLIICFGPCIGKCHFEVSDDVKQIYEEEFGYLKSNKEIIKSIGKDESGNNKYLIDAVLANRLVLENIGIPKDNIIESKICTVCNSEYMHSYRKDKDKSGRNVAIIGMKK